MIEGVNGVELDHATIASPFGKTDYGIIAAEDSTITNDSTDLDKGIKMAKGAKLQLKHDGSTGTSISVNYLDYKDIGNSSDYPAVDLKEVA